jgi:glycosyltransferase involved in cell wall biosynthesis
VRPRICFVLPSLNGGGAERAAVHVLNALDGERWHKTMYLFDREGPYLRDVDHAVEIVAGTSRSRMGRWWQLRRHLRTTRPQIVMSFLSYVSVLSAARAAAAGARVIFNQQTPMSAFLTDADYHWRRPSHRRLFAAATRVGYRLADAIITTSSGVADDLVTTFGVPRERIRIVANPVDLETIARAVSEPLEPDHERRWTRPAIVAAGRLADAKNYPLLLDAFARVRDATPARLFVLGEGEREAALRAQAAALRLTDDVVFCGFQRNPWRYIARADVFALTSRYEGFGNVLIEAMACGTPVVATASAGTRDIVRDGVDGLLVERHDPASVAAALVSMLSDDRRRVEMSAAARLRAQTFALAAVTAQYDEVFTEVLA